jgi:hypothetical protein
MAMSYYFLVQRAPKSLGLTKGIKRMIMLPMEAEEHCLCSL